MQFSLNMTSSSTRGAHFQKPFCRRCRSHQTQSQNSPLGPAWDPLGPALKSLGPSLDSSGSLGALLGLLWNVLGSPWGAFETWGPPWGALRDPLDANAAKNLVGVKAAHPQKVILVYDLVRFGVAWG